VDEAGRSAKPPLMTASAAEDVDSDTVSRFHAEDADDVDDFSGGAAANFSPEGAAVGIDDDEGGDTAAGLNETDAADDAADGTFSWSSSAWDSSAWDSSVSADSAGSDAFGNSSAGFDGSYSPSPLSSPATRADVPFPADQIGKAKSDVSTLGDTTGRENTRAEELLSAGSGDAADPDDASGRDGSSTVDRLGAAAAGFGSRLDLNGKLDRGRQAWRQAMTGPNNWLSSRISSSSTGTSPSPVPPATARSVFAPARDSSSAAAGYSTERVGSSVGYGEPAGYSEPSGYSEPAGYSGSVPSSASYGGPAAGTAPSSAGASSVGSPAARTGAAYAGSRPGTGSSTSSLRGRATVGARGKRKNSRRQAQLTLSRVEPWSVMKFSFVVSVVAFIVLFVAVALLYMVVSSLGVFSSLQTTVSTLTGSKDAAGTNVTSWFSASRILGYTGMLGALNIVLITAISTIGAVIYNLIAHAFGGIEVTLRETE
jgi:hypothetical protein